MKLLALDTSTEACSAAVLLSDQKKNEQIFSRFELQPNQQSKLLLPMLDNLLSEAGVALSSLDAIAFGSGPGSFTGLRIAASVTQGMALAHDLPVIPVSSLQTMAETAYQEFGFKKILAAIDAHVQAFYYGAFLWDEAFQCMKIAENESLISPDNWITPEGDSWEYVGTGWRYFDVNNNKINYYPKASAMLTLAQKMAEQKNWVAPEDALPSYLYELGNGAK